MVGQKIGNYQIVRLLGEGGMGAVYLAEHPGLGRRVAVKVLHPDLPRSEEMTQRLFNEARAANTIGHRGIVEFSDFGVLPSGAPYLVMEFLDGESLAARMTRAGRLSLPAAVAIADQAAGALAAAHAHGIIHRDLKPDNLFLIRDPHQAGRELVKILDFGIAKLARPPINAGEVRTRTGAILGTPRYMSPEQCRDSRDVDHRIDIYALGVILYEMLSGAPPFLSRSWGELAHMHIGVKPESLRTRVPDLPDSVDRIVLRALEKDPAARFQSMAELQEALAGTTTLERTQALPERTLPFAPPGSTRRLDPPPALAAPRWTTLAGAASEIKRGLGRTERRRPLLAAAAAAVVGSLVAALAVVALRSVQREPPAAAEPPALTQPATTPAAPPPPAVAPAPTPVPAPAPAAQLPAPPAAPPENISIESQPVVAPRNDDHGHDVAPKPRKIAKPPARAPRTTPSEPPRAPPPRTLPPEPHKV